MRRTKEILVVLLAVASVAGMTAPAVALDSGTVDSGAVTAADTSTTMDHSEGDPPDDPGNNGSEVPGVGRPPCIPPQDPGHGQPSCIPPDHANNPDNANKSNGGGNNAGGRGNGNGGGNGSSSSGTQGLVTAFADLFGL